LDLQLVNDTSIKGNFMFFKTLTLAAVLLVSGGAAMAGGDHTARHGGIVVETRALDFEIVAKPDSIQVYLADHGKPVKLDGAKGKVTLLNGTEKTELDLAVAGDRLEAKGAFKVQKGTRGVVSVTLAGKPGTVARFEVK
jgi:hypothetical protein